MSPPRVAPGSSSYCWKLLTPQAFNSRTGKVLEEVIEWRNLPLDSGRFLAPAWERYFWGPYGLILAGKCFLGARSDEI